jgi:photosystem II stability/assembly factor-like uncharacterized protein
MTPVARGLLCSVAIALGVVGALATGSGQAVSGKLDVTLSVGPTRLVSPGFGYSVAYRAVTSGTTAETAIRLFVYEDGRWRNATPPALAANQINAIDDVAFADRRHGWVAGYNCAQAAVYIYRTSDGGRSWQSLGKPATHSCGGGPTYLSFADDRHGWMEPVSPNGPAGELLGTADGGRTWKQLASGPPGQARPPALPCLAPIRFVSRSRGWMARCEDGGMFSTRDGGRRWSRARIGVPDRADARFDLPWFAGGSGVVAATIGSRPPTEPSGTRAVVFSVTRNGGRDWSVRATRRVSSCSLTPYFTNVWPASVAGLRVWWVVAGRSRPVVQVTSDGGRQWRRVVARGLPSRSCSVTSVSAATASVAWVVARGSGANTFLFRTADGGRSWHRVIL